MVVVVEVRVVAMPGDIAKLGCDVITAGPRGPAHPGPIRVEDAMQRPIGGKALRQFGKFAGQYILDKATLTASVRA